MSATSLGLRSAPGARPDGLDTNDLDRGHVVAAARRIRAYTIVGRSAGVTNAGERLAGCSAEFAKE